MPIHAKKQGYTIVEVMIFLAITSVMFLMAATFVSGKQARAQFKDGVNDMASQIQAVINDVGNGVYPDKTKITCTADTVGNQPTIISSASTDKSGEHLGCVYIGKAMHFRPKIGAASDPTKFNVYTIAARQYVDDPNKAVLPSNFAEAKPKTVDTAGADVTLRNTNKWSLKVIKLVNIPSTGSPVDLDGFGFFSSFSSYDGAGTLQSGSQNLTSVVIPGSGNVADLNATINTPAQMTANIQATPNIVMCLTDGNEYATINIGGSRGQRISTTTHIYDNLPAGC